MDAATELQLMEHPDSTEEIPVIDIADYLAGKPGARERIGQQLREVSETVGFFYLIGHGIEQAQFDRIFGASRALHTSSLEQRRTIAKPSRRSPGYDAREDKVFLGGVAPPTLNSSFTLQRERPADDPKYALQDPFYQRNRWPDWLPGFKETVIDYRSTIGALGQKMMPLWATALGVAPDYFDDWFSDPYMPMSLLHYPHQDVVGNNQYGIQPHTDNSLMTFLAQGDMPGLAVQMPSGRWRIAEVLPGSLLINSGNTMVRLSNGRFKSTKHVVRNTTGRDRYSIPVFFGCDLPIVIEALPPFVTAENPVQYPPIVYRELMEWYLYKRGNFAKSAGPDVKGEGFWVAGTTTNGHTETDGDSYA